MESYESPQLATKRGGFHHRYVTVDGASGSVWAGATSKSPEAFGMT